MKYQIYSAIDAIDDAQSLFMFDENDNYTVVCDRYTDSDYLEQLARNGEGCNWIDNKNGTPRRQYMINPVLVKEFEV